MAAALNTPHSRASAAWVPYKLQLTCTAGEVSRDIEATAPLGVEGGHRDREHLLAGTQADEDGLHRQSA